ncbi:hypothetical protein MVEN_01127000 [Mycena venus]|uniref:AB hydrolase-1 domain-containing protein n=1 Tax=Mycena venus TaxID=2733690 RepID=A0A8H6Y9L8_9AGAR|nr:hypothetical protein MVEN_01127000 [Mycena venus]
MKTTVYGLNPSVVFPFHVQAVQYVPESSWSNGLTLIFFHATGTHKESFEPVVHCLFRDPLAVHVRDVWCIENPNHGSSAVLNRALLDTPEYRDKWNTIEYCRAAHTFLNSTEHGIDFRARPLVGLSHSAGSSALLMLQRMHPLVKFKGLVLMDAPILPIGTPATRALLDLFGNGAKRKPNTWHSLEAAREELSRTVFKHWDPFSVDLFVNHAISPEETSGNVTLLCSVRQEAAYFLSPETDLAKVPFEIFLQLVNEDRLPMHIILCLNDEYKQVMFPGFWDIEQYLCWCNRRGKALEMKQFQIDNSNRMSRDRASVQIVEGGHMFPQTQPAICAQAIAQALERIQLQQISSRL